MFENLRAMPPAFIIPSSGITVVKDEKAQLELIRSPGFDPQRTVVVEEPLGIPSTDGATGNVQWISRKNASLQLKVESETHSVLVLSQVFYPGW
jgi:hypothetical protein